MCCNAGGLEFTVDDTNLEAALYCHDKYECAALEKAAKAYIAWAEEAEAIVPALSAFKASSRFMDDHTHSYHKCGNFLAEVLPHIEGYANHLFARTVNSR